LYLGKSEDLDLEVYELKHGSNSDPRVSLATDGFKIMKQRGQYKALFVYIASEGSDWRLSLMTMDPKVNEKGKVGLDFSNPKRYSYFLGQNAKVTTPNRFLVKLGKVKDFEDLKGRFAIEVIDKEFFNSYKQLFLQLNDYLQKDHAFKIFAEKQGIKTEIFAKKLLGQIVFIYFLQRKGWLGAKKEDKINQGDKHFLRNQFAKCIKDGKNFYNDCLEFLFYDCLNKKTDKAASFYRSHFDCQIPFLNGGLFEPINDYDWEKEFLNIPNNIFSDNTEQPEKGKGILDVFDLYNFTVDENTPDDQEVSVDPEMLGKVFENLLETNLRKGTGSYYTPREIVHYMCKESLINYLVSNIDISEDNARKIITRNFVITQEDVENFYVNNEDGPNKSLAFWDGDAKDLSDLLKNIKIVDPACGSGAFLVGMLQQIAMARSLMQEFTGEKYSDYDLKKQTIQNCIYGVDIDPGAIDIAKLRLWLSLVVDHEIDDIEPLPNLDYKIMQGNSLLEDLVVGDSVIPLKFNGTNRLDGRTKEMKNLFEEEKQGKLILDKSETLADKLEKYHNQYFLINDSQEKKILKNKIDDIEDQLIQSKCSEELTRLKEQAANPVNFKKLTKITERQLAIQGTLNQWKKDHLRPFFPWKLHFGEVFRVKGGFDVVIGNPPYVDYRKIDNNTKKGIINFHISAHSRMINLYTYFYELGIKLLTVRGVLVYISPQQYLILDNCRGLRDLLRNSRVILLADFARVKVFTASTYTFITLILKDEPRGSLKYLEFDQIKDLNHPIQNFEIKNPIPEPVNISQNLYLIEKIEETSNTKLGRLADVFCATSSTSLQLVQDMQQGLPLISAKDIKNWYLTTPKIYVAKNSYSENSLLKQSGNVIYTSRMTNSIRAVFIKNNRYLGGKVNVIKPNDGTLALFIVALLNSKIINFWYQEKFKMQHMQGGALPINAKDLKKIPVVVNNKVIIEKIAAIAKDITHIKIVNQKADVTELESKINHFLYTLYKLTKEEINTIENF